MSQFNKVKDFSTNTLLFMIGSFGTKIISFLLVPLYTYVLSTADYGNLDFVSTTAQLLVPVMTLNIQDSILRFCLDKHYNPNLVIKVGIRIVGIAILILACGLFVYWLLFPCFADVKYIVYLFCLFVVNAFYNIFSMYLKAINKVKLFVICGLITTVIMCTLNIVLLLVVKMGVLGFLIANISSVAVSVCIMVIGGEVFKIDKTHESIKALSKEMIIFSTPLITNTLAWWINGASDRYILTFFCGIAVNGVYAIAYKIPTILATVQGVFYNSWSISAIKEFDKNDSDGFIGDIYMMYSFILTIVCSFLMMFNFFIASIMYSNEFIQAWQYVPTLLVGTLFNGMALFEGCLFTAVKKTKAVSLSTLLGAAANTFFNIALIPFFGAIGAAIATMLGYMIICLVRTIQLKSIIQFKINRCTSIIALLVIIIQCFVATLFKELYYQIPFFILLIVSQKNSFWQLCNKIRNRDY